MPFTPKAWATVTKDKFAVAKPKPRASDEAVWLRAFYDALEKVEWAGYDFDKFAYDNQNNSSFKTALPDVVNNFFNFLNARFPNGTNTTRQEAMGELTKINDFLAFGPWFENLQTIVKANRSNLPLQQCFGMVYWARFYIGNVASSLSNFTTFPDNTKIAELATWIAPGSKTDP